MSGWNRTYTRSFPATAESVPQARAELTEFARRCGVAGDQLDAVRLVISEAVTNAVVHAYDASSRAERLVQVCASAIEDDFWLLVADEGGGLRSGIGGQPGLGLGLVLISQLTEDLDVVRRGGGGTELRMRFKLPAGEAELEDQPRGSFSAAISPASPSFSTTR